MRPASISSDQVAIASSKSWYIRGVYLSGLNPKVLLLFLALSPPFMDPQAALSPTSPNCFIGEGIHLMSCAAVYFLVGFSAQKVLGTRPQAARVVQSSVRGIDDVDCDDFIVRTVLCLSDILSIWIKGSAK